MPYFRKSIHLPQKIPEAMLVSTVSLQSLDALMSRLQVEFSLSCYLWSVNLDFMAENQHSFNRRDRFFPKLLYSYVFKHFIQTEVKGLESTGRQFILYTGAGKNQAKLRLLHLELMLHALERGREPGPSHGL